MKRNRFIITGITLIFTIIFLSGPVSAVSFHIDDAHFTSAGQVITRDLVCDALPQGLSGFNISIAVKDSSVGAITGVIFPDWAAPKASSTVPASLVWVKAVDMNNQVKPGDTDVVFVHILMKGNGPGTTGFTITPVELDDENGNAIVVTAPPPSTVPTINPQETVSSATQAGGGPAETPGTTLVQTATPIITISGSTTPLTAPGKEVTVPTPQVIYVNASPVVVYVTVTQKTPITPFLAIVAIGIVGIALTLSRKLER